MESMKLFNVNIKVKHKKSKFRMKEHLVGKTNIIDSSFSKETNMATMPAWEYNGKPESGWLFQGIGYIIMEY